MQLDAAWVQTLQKPETWVRTLVPLLVVASLYLCARIIWTAVDLSTASYQIDKVAAPAAANSTGSGVTVSVAAIVNKHLFGDATAQPEEPVLVEQVAAAETQLPLKLRGIYASTDNNKASAIIESGGGKQAVYFIGEAIDGARGAVLHQVRTNQVLINRSGQLESLTLEQEESAFTVEQAGLSAPANSVGASPRSMQMVDNPRIKRELNELRNKLQTDPASLQDMITWEPVMENGMITGVKIAPGKARRLFNQLKLRRNDIVTNINGIPLNDPSQLLMLRDTLSNANEVSLTLMRNGQEQSISISLAEDAR